MNGLEEIEEIENFCKALGKEISTSERIRMIIIKYERTIENQNQVIENWKKSYYNLLKEYKNLKQKIANICDINITDDDDYEDYD